MSTAQVTPEKPSTGKKRRRLGSLGRSVDLRVQALQSAYLAGSPSARAELAKLRRGLGKAPGAVPEIWDLTIAVVPPDLAWDGDEPSRAELAAHAALTLYALHQQSMNRPAHTPGVGFGAAVRHLAAGQAAAAVTRRFMAVATAESIDELLTHARGLITQLRSEDRGLDYGMLADDILALMTPGREARVKLAWGRGFYRSTGNDSTGADGSVDDKDAGGES